MRDRLDPSPLNSPFRKRIYIIIDNIGIIIVNNFLIKDKEHKGLEITAVVGFLSLSSHDELLVAVRNKRGWDIPGGHINMGETEIEAFKREVLEETGCKVVGETRAIAILESVTRPGTGIKVLKGRCDPGNFYPTDEILERKFMSKDELLEDYFGDKIILSGLMSLAEKA